MPLCFIEPELLPIAVLHCGNRYFDLFALVTFTNLTRIPWRYTGCVLDMNFLRVIGQIVTASPDYLKSNLSHRNK